MAMEDTSMDTGESPRNGDDADDRAEDEERPEGDDRGTDEPREEATAPADPDRRIAELEAQLELLRAEHRRLREVAAAAKRSRYRRAAMGLAIVGVLALAAGLAFPGQREVLFALGGTGVFAGLLTYYLTPERFISADVGERVYAALAGTLEEAIRELGLAEKRVYVPLEDGDGVRLYVPQHDTDTVPPEEELASTFVVGDNPDMRGMATEPTGGPLFAEFREARTGPTPGTAPPAARELREGLLEVFEFGDAADVDVEVGRDGGRVTLELTDPVYGPGDRFDHPAVSFVAVGLARALERPVRADVDRTEPLVASFRWGSDDSGLDDPGQAESRQDESSPDESGQDESERDVS